MGLVVDRALSDRVGGAARRDDSAFVVARGATLLMVLSAPFPRGVVKGALPVDMAVPLPPALPLLFREEPNDSGGTCTPVRWSPWLLCVAVPLRTLSESVFSAPASTAGVGSGAAIAGRGMASGDPNSHTPCGDRAVRGGEGDAPRDDLRVCEPHSREGDGWGEDGLRVREGGRNPLLEGDERTAFGLMLSPSALAVFNKSSSERTAAAGRFGTSTARAVAVATESTLVAREPGAVSCGGVGGRSSGALWR